MMVSSKAEENLREMRGANLMKYCPKCGKQLGDHMKFCGHCGTALTASAAAPWPAKHPEKKPTMAARATCNKKPTMAVQAVKESRKREEFLCASMKEKRSMMDSALNELLDGRLPVITARVNKTLQRAKSVRLPKREKPRKAAAAA